MSYTKETIRIYWQAAKRYPKLLFPAMFIMPIPVIAQSIIYPLIFADIIDKLNVYASGGDVTRSEVISQFGWLIALGLIDLIGWRIVDFLLVNHQVKVLRDLDRKVFDWYLQMSYNFHVNSFGGSLVARGRRFVSEYERLFDTMTFEVLTLLLRFTAYILVLGFRAPSIALVISVWAFFYIGAQIYITRKKTKYSRAAADADSAVTAQLADTITNISSVKSFGSLDYENERFYDVTHDHYKKRRFSWLLDTAIRSWQAFWMISVTLLVIYLSIDGLFNGIITIGTVVLVYLYVFRLLNDLWGFSRTIVRIERGLSDASEMTKTFMTPVDVKDIDEPEPGRVKNGSIEMKDMTFRYQDANEDDEVFSNLNLTIKPGTRVGLVGPSGGGKSTITKLLLRLYDLDSGSIIIDGIDIAKMPQNELRSAIAYVPQEPVLFHRSLTDNIRYGKLMASKKEIAAAAKLARADLFIDKLPKKYETLVGERGTKLSGGEKQRVAIARAALKNAPILLLDEATSALDSESESHIQAALDDLMKDRTTIVIAHRLSTIQKMDRIIVLDEGEIIEDGTHQELLRKKGVYAELWSHQSGGFLEE